MIYAMSDIHGCYEAFDAALSLADLSGENKLVLLGDYVHGGEDGYKVLDRIMALQQKYGAEKVIALMGNHEEAVISRTWRISESRFDYFGGDYPDDECDDKYISWMRELPLYYFEGNTIFCHAGIDEKEGEMWEICTDKYTFANKYPAQLGKFYCGGQDLKIVAGHIGTAEISENPHFHDIYFDGESHYYIDGTVLDSGEIPVLAVDTKADKYYCVTDSGLWIVEAYDEN